MGRRRKRSRDDGKDAELEMTPMIDVVFQLLIFFIVTLKQPEVIGRLDVFHPSPDSNTTPETQIEDMVRITVLADRYMLNQSPMGLATMERNLRNLARRSASQTVLIQCAVQSRHERLVAILDLCTKVGLSNLNVVTK